MLTLGAASAEDRAVGRAPREGKPMGHIEQHHAVNAEAEEHCGRAGGGGRQPGARKAQRAEHQHERQGRRQRPDADQPQAAEHHEEQRQNQCERPDRVEDALALDDGLGLDRDPMTAGEFDRQGWPCLARFSRWITGPVGQRGPDGHEARVKGACEDGVVRRPSRSRDDEPRPSVGGDIAIASCTDVEAGLAAAECVAQQVEQAEGILPDERGDIRRWHRQQLPSAGERVGHACGLEPGERLIERGLRQQEQLPVGDPAKIARAVDDACVHALDLGRRPERSNPRVNLVLVIGD